MASTFIRVLNVEIVTLFFFIQMNSGKVLSIAFLFIFLLIIFGSIGFYIYKAIKCK